MVGGGLILLGIVAGALGNSDAALVGKSDIELLRAEERLSYAVEQALVSEDVGEGEETSRERDGRDCSVRVGKARSEPPVKKKKVIGGLTGGHHGVPLEETFRPSRL